VGQYQIVRCRVCGLFYTNPRPPAQDAPKIYGEDYFASQNPSTLGYDNYRTHEGGLREVFSENLAIIEGYSQPPSLMIDIGCAFGYFIEAAAARGWTVEGLEVSEYAAEVARRNAKVPIHAGTLSGLRLPASTYDIVTMWDMLEHSFDPTAELMETNRILRPEGHLFLTIPNAGSFLASTMGSHWYGFKKVAEHNYFFSKDTLGRLFAKTGFRALEWRRGVWPCSLQFLTAKLAPYSTTLSRIAEKAVKSLGIEKTTIKFRFIDMFVAAVKEQNFP